LLFSPCPLCALWFFEPIPGDTKKSLKSRGFFQLSHPIKRDTKDVVNPHLPVVRAVVHPDGITQFPDGLGALEGRYLEDEEETGSGGSDQKWTTVS